MSTNGASELLTHTTVLPFLRGAGLLAATEDVEVLELAGGVSNTVLGVHTPRGDWVVKQSLPRLKVADQWLATQQRTITEATALDMVHKISPAAVPAVVHLDPDAFVLVIDWARGAYVPWKSLLLDGAGDESTGASLGDLLAYWHDTFAGRPSELEAIDAPEAFEQLRVDPFYRTVALRRPELADAIEQLIDQMHAQPSTLVHGDFSPKNVLVDPARPSEPVVIDFEVAHRGDPAFDVAFMLSHLLLKMCREPTDAPNLRRIGAAFLHAYQAGTHDLTAGHDPLHLCRHLGALVLSRTDGKSPVDYLHPTGAEAARTLGRALLLDDEPTNPFDLEPS